MMKTLSWFDPIRWPLLQRFTAKGPEFELSRLSLSKFLHHSGGPAFLFHLHNRWRTWLRTLLLLAGIMFCAVGSYPFHQAIQSQNWQVVDGKISHSGFVAAQQKQSDSWQLFYYTAVEYEYSVERQRHTGHHVEFGLADQSFFFKEFADRILQRYPVGKPVRVYVNPQQAGEAVLERTPSMGGGFLLVLLGGFCLLCRPLLVNHAALSTSQSMSHTTR
ncbi:MAG: DUF3592 domain-containing protein [Magnetococcales bacterium]|nr:DUF3592 domain-containing protein [Magnetococcales bacterium]MBF0113498.1 DUF3592 domain-containing protein [Magnetococcales bacterium]